VLAVTSSYSGCNKQWDFEMIAQLKSQVNLTDQQKYFLLKKHYVPTSNYKFPTRVINKIHQHFQHRWLEKNPGLVYSSQCGGYCKYCVLLGKVEQTVKEHGVFVTKPFTF